MAYKLPNILLPRNPYCISSQLEPLLNHCSFLQKSSLHLLQYILRSSGLISSKHQGHLSYWQNVTEIKCGYNLGMHVKSIACFNVTITAHRERCHIINSWTNQNQKKVYLRKLWSANVFYRISLRVWTYWSEIWTGKVYFNFYGVPFQLSYNLTMPYIISWLFSWLLTRHMPQKEKSCSTLLKAFSGPRDKRVLK